MNEKVDFMVYNKFKKNYIEGYNRVTTVYLQRYDINTIKFDLIILDLTPPLKNLL